MNFLKTFKKKNRIVIGAVHFPPLVGYKDFPGFEVAKENALADVMAFELGGADAVIFENNYDVPHTEFVSPEIAELMEFLGREIVKATTLPVGINVLWNDYKTAFTIAKKLALKFIRVPVFVDTVKTDYGVIEGRASEIINFRKNIGADEVMIFADIHVKHSELLSKFSITESAKLAVTAGADALIVTGKWTGDAPDLKDLISVRDTVGDFPILCGSGVDKNNALQLFERANGAIVSTALKSGRGDKREVNVKPYSDRIIKEKVKTLVESLRN